MRYILIFTAILFSTNFAVAKKRAHKAHVHGEGKFTLAVEGRIVEMEMEIPADDIVGFEHMPKTPEQKKAVKTAEKKLKEATEMVLLPEKAQCRATSVEVESPLTKHDEKHDEKHHKKGHHHDHDDKESHSEFHITYKFKCDVPKHLSQVTVNLFSAFPSLKELEGQAVTMDGPFSAELTAKKRTFKLFK